MDQVLEVISTKQGMVYGWGFLIFLISFMSIVVLFGSKGLRDLVIAISCWFLILFWNKNVVSSSWCYGFLKNFATWRGDGPQSLESKSENGMVSMGFRLHKYRCQEGENVGFLMHRILWLRRWVAIWRLWHLYGFHKLGIIWRSPLLCHVCVLDLETIYPMALLNVKLCTDLTECYFKVFKEIRRSGGMLVLVLYNIGLCMSRRSSFYSSEAFFTDYGDIAVLVRSGGLCTFCNKIGVTGSLVVCLSSFSRCYFVPNRGRSSAY